MDLPRCAALAALALDAPILLALRGRLSAETWEGRIAEAREHLATIEAVESAIKAGETNETKAIASHGNGMDRGTYRRLRARYGKFGFAGLVDQRVPPPEPLKATAEVRAAICVMREVDPHIEVERIAEVVARRCGVTVSTTVIKEVLHEAGLNRPPGGGVHHSALRSRKATPLAPAEEQIYAGALFLRLADERTGYSAGMASAIHEAAAATVASAPAPTAPRLEEAGSRDARGRFTAIYNKANLKVGARLGPAFRSIVEKRREVQLGARRLAQEGVATIQRKCQAVLMLPLLTDNGRTVQVDDYRAHHGLAELCGHAYTGETLERFLRDLKYLGLGDAMMNQHAAFWMAQEPHQEGEGPPAAFMLYVDGSNKALWTPAFTKCGKVSDNGRVMPCLDQVLVHTGTGTPIFWQTFSGHASLVTHAPAALAAVEKLVGTGWEAGSLVIMDSEACAVGLFRAFAEAKPRRHLITRLKPSLTPPLSAFRELSDFEPYRSGDEVADGFITLRDSKEKDKTKAMHELRAVVVRRTRAGQTSVLVTDSPRDDLSARAVADAYFERWSRQELRFKTFGAANFKGVAGYGKQLVENVAVVTELDRLPDRRKRLEKQIGGQEKVVTDLYALLKEARKAVTKAEERRARQDGQVAKELFAEAPDLDVVCARVDMVIGERDRLAGAKEAAAAAEVEHRAAVAKLAALRQEFPKLDEKAKLLDSRKEIFQADTELDRIFSIYKLGFVLLCELALREFFEGLNISLATFMRQILTLPGKRVVDGYQEFIQLAIPPNKEIRAALEAACERVNAQKLRRNGLVLRLSVGPPGRGQHQTSRSTS